MAQDKAADLIEYHAAGGVVWDGEHVLVLHRPSRAEVRLPKGHIDPGESAQTAALRETAEESGYHGLAVLADLGELTVHYSYQGRRYRRFERYFLLGLTPGSEVKDPEKQFVPAWLNWQEALDQVTYAAERTWLERAWAAAQALP